MKDVDPKKVIILFVGVRELIGYVDSMPPESNFNFYEVADIKRQVIETDKGKFAKIGVTLPRTKPIFVRNYQMRTLPEKEELEMYEEARQAAFTSRTRIALPKKGGSGLAGPDGRPIDPLLTGSQPASEG